MTVKTARALSWILVFLLVLSACSAAPAPEPEPETEPIAPAAEEAEEILPEETATVFTPGTAEGYEYRNELLGYGCYLDGWSFETTGQWSESEIFMDVIARSPDGLQIMTVQFQHISLADCADDFTEEALPRMTDELAAAGYENIALFVAEEVFVSDSRITLTMQADADGIPVEQKQVLIDCGEYTAIVTATAYLGTSPGEILMRFYQL